MMIRRIMVLCVVFSSQFLYSQEEYRGVISRIFTHRIADYEFQLTDTWAGARGAAMGGANIAAANDLTSIAWNPAALTSVSGLSFMLTSKMSFNSQVHDSPRYTGIALSTEVTPLLSVDYAAVGYSRQLAGRCLALGLSFRPYHDMNQRSETLQYAYGGGRVKEVDSNKGGIQVVSPAVAVDVFSFLSLGMSFNKIFGSSDYDLQIVSPYADKLLYFEYSDREDYSGSYVDVGAKITPFKWLSVSAILTPQWDLTVDEKTQDLDYLNVLTLRRVIKKTPSDSLNTFTFQIPLSYGIGLLIKPMEQMSIALDVKSQAWSKSDVQVTNGQKNPMMQQLFDTMDWHAGFEYVVNAQRWLVPLRFGLFDVQTPYKDKLFNTKYLGDQIKAAGWSLGFGLNFQKVIFNFAFTKKSVQYGWWMTASDYYNHRMFLTHDNYNEIFLSCAYKL
jgi:hypothetical protein